MKSNKGFSLVELIVVIAIMAIIAAVAVPVYNTYITKAEAAVVTQKKGEIDHAAEVVEISQLKKVSITCALAQGSETSYVATISGGTAAERDAAAEELMDICANGTKGDDDATNSKLTVTFDLSK